MTDVAEAPRVDVHADHFVAVARTIWKMPERLHDAFPILASSNKR
jgi:hypothetical protein